MGKRKIMRIFLIGMLCGVMLAAAFTFVFAIPANNYRWQDGDLESRRRDFDL